jgi:hypothetical protein
MQNPGAYFEKIKKTLSQNPYTYFRYHSSGDIPDENYLQLMCQTATLIKRVKFLCFTKKYEMINEYIIKNGNLPKNLTVVLSNWGDFQCKNPHNLPIAYVNIKGAKIPESANKCSGYCGECVNTKQSCWKLKKGDSVVFKIH